MAMYNPPHHGEFIYDVYLEPNKVTARELAGVLGVSPSTLHRVLNGMSGVSPSMALRLSMALGRSAESWLSMQSNFDLWHARRTVKLTNVGRFKLLSN